MKTPPKVDFKDPEVKNNINSREDQDIIDNVSGRTAEMESGRRVVDLNWTDYQAQLEALWSPYPDGRSSFALPVTRALVERGIAEEIRIPVTRIIRAEREDYQDRATAYEEVRTEVGRQNNFDWELMKNAYTCWLYGTSIIYTHFERTIKEQYEASFSAFDDIDYKKKYVIQNGILVEDFNINNFYPDNRVIEWSDAVDCYADQIVPYDSFLELANQKVYKNIDKVSPVGYYANYTNNLSQEERTKTGKYVHIRNYWNLAKDMYIAVANKSTIIRCHPIWTTKKGAKCMPFTMRRLGYNARSLYGVGMGYYGQQVQSNMNDVSEMIFDGIRRSTQETMIFGNNLDIEGQKVIYGNTILKANGLLNGNIDRFQGSPPNQAVFEGRDMLLRDINRFIGLDLENLVADASTAFQANLIAESQQKMVNVWLKNRDMAMEEVEDKVKDLIQNYYPLDVPYRIVDSLTNIQPETPTIEVKGKKYDKRSGSFSNTRNPNHKSVVDVDMEMLKGDYYVDTTTNTSDTASGAIRKAQILDYTTAMNGVVTAYAQAQEAGLQGLINPQDTLKQIAEAYNIPQKETTNEREMKKLADEAKNKLRALMPGASAPGSLPTEQPTAPTTNPPAGPTNGFPQ